MASGQKRIVRGAYIGTGSLIEVKTVGFRPSAVVLKSQAGDEAHWQDEDMPDAAMHKRVATGVGSYVTTNGITPLSNGFSIGADADLNAATEKVHWTAYD